MNPEIERLNRSRRDKLDWAARLGLGPLSHGGGQAVAPAPVMPRMGLDSPENSEEEEEERRKSEQRLASMRRKHGGSAQPIAVPPPTEDEDLDGSGFFAAPAPKKKPLAQKTSVLDLRITTNVVPIMSRAFPQPGAGAANDIFDDRPKDDEEDKKDRDDDDDDESQSPRDEKKRTRGRSRDDDYDRSRSRDRRHRYDDDYDSSEERRNRKREDRKKREEWRRQYAKMKGEEERSNRKKKLAAKFSGAADDAAGRGQGDDDNSGSDSEEVGEDGIRFKEAKATERERAGEAPINPPAQYEPLQRKYVGQLRDSEIDERLRAAEAEQRRSGHKLMTEAEVMAMMKMGAKRRR
mmetsp:Transcript_17202/g.30162  ORF Transcript_17202/g.30162 Transcript_17202/m.30162 type:complete len:350 (-) Transcript_17202:65-1114(-)|eukprot:CAMPEP_0197636704 /NCGR_PEP_ID=MMETSP1338-20131121/12125_1 /TAXON_ID=43686 ORGANISM="Pelagodinium beii, Strain RCC1491" /NCGR_SAMPLE_ID=MMETSP1338 /ASSEMBLY_ACC=CAM_ASM_000754 /LENGTH=349 /DNA_ID=CAMNT_0043208977 /DNA_START=111 /DNA_END=1160 /DNA_ORIENTATION=+